MPPSKTRRARSTSIVKSTCPGVSIMLMCASFHLQKVAADWIVIPLFYIRFCCCSMFIVIGVYGFGLEMST